MIICLFIFLFRHDLKVFFFEKGFKHIKYIWHEKGSFILNILVLGMALFTLKVFKLNVVYTTLCIICTTLSFLMSILWMINFNNQYQDYQNLCQTALEMSADFKQNKKTFKALKTFMNETQFEKSMEDGALDINYILTYSNHYIFISMIKMMHHHEMYGDKHIISVLNSLENDFELWLEDVKLYYENCYEYIRQLNLILILTLMVAIMGQNMLIKTGYLKPTMHYQKAYFYFFVFNVIIYLQAHTIFKKPMILKEECVVKEN